MGVSIFGLLLCVIIALLYAALLYYKNRKDDFSSRWRYGLATLRALCVFTILFLFVSPTIRIKEEKIDKPLILLAFDASSSMQWKQNGIDKNELSKIIKKFIQGLGNNYRVRTVSFGEGTREGIDIDKIDNYTDFSDLFSFISPEFEYSSGAVVLLSDGRYNFGRDPLYDYKRIGSPLYSICIGDTTDFQDWFIERLEHNRYAYKGQDFPIRVVVGASNSGSGSDKNELWLNISKNGKLLNRQNVSKCFPNGDTIVYITAEDIGIQHYDVFLSGSIEEKDKSNNSKTFSIEVMEEKTKVLILAHHEHPDLGVLRRALEKSENYELFLKVGDKLQIEKGVEESYDLCIMHGLPAFDRHIGIDLSQVKTFWYIITPTTSVTEFNALNLGIKMPLNVSFGEATAFYDANFGYFESKGAELMNEMPPLNAPRGMEPTSKGQVEASGQSGQSGVLQSGLSHGVLQSGQLLFKQGIMGIESSYPLWWFGQKGEYNVGVLAGEGLWKWRLGEYIKTESTDIFDHIVEKTVQLLSVKNNNDLLQVKTADVYIADKKVKVSAFLYDLNGELVKNADIKLVLKDTSETQYDFVFTPVFGGYEADCGVLPSGNYSYEATAVLGEKKLSVKGGFSVEIWQMEQSNLPVNREGMQQWSARYDGKSYWTSYLDIDKAFSKLELELKSREDIKARLGEEERELSLLHKPWIIIMLFILMFGEYLIRKQRVEI